MSEPVPVLLTVDLVVLSVRADDLQVLLVRRGIEPYADAWALPGGFVLDGEDLPDAAARELAEETGFDRARVHVEQLATYGAATRDPRGRVVTVAHLALVSDPGEPRGGSDAAEAAWVPVREVPGRELAFDHERILADGIERARAKLEYSALGAALLGSPFTVAELRRVYEIVWGESLDPRNFHRKVTGVAGFLEPTGETRTERGRPAALFTAGPAGVLHPPITRQR
ncbi:NUDIX hydrolase [Marmoricola endophyticus]|uniref:NUDIX hydrolase n=1 Tax=Marmoricola endophyticus TaxID=2040280 RepID=A0A917BNB4_9ACTN|nr:NUDIX domain-containing protein [Marmoricola endophyticus]GGF52679.1 NUDIX hydrolase [Marmoricola endophyticus]